MSGPDASAARILRLMKLDAPNPDVARVVEREIRAEAERMRERNGEKVAAYLTRHGGAVRTRRSRTRGV